MQGPLKTQESKHEYCKAGRRQQDCPVGRDAQANLDVYLRATILAYSRARCLFAGVSLEGSILRPDNGANEKLYGKKVPAKMIVLDSMAPIPPAAEKLISTLNELGQKGTTEKAGE